MAEITIKTGLGSLLLFEFLDSKCVTRVKITQNESLN